MSSGSERPSLEMPASPEPLSSPQASSKSNGPARDIFVAVDWLSICCLSFTANENPSLKKGNVRRRSIRQRDCDRSFDVHVFA